MFVKRVGRKYGDGKIVMLRGGMVGEKESRKEGSVVDICEIVEYGVLV